MLEDQESEFILSIFLMEAWDTVASVEEGARRLASRRAFVLRDPRSARGGRPPAQGRGRPSRVPRGLGRGARDGEPARAASQPCRRRSTGRSRGARRRGGHVRRMLEMIGDDGREDVDTVGQLRSRHPELFPAPAVPEPPPVSVRQVERTPAAPTSPAAAPAPSPLKSPPSPPLVADDAAPEPTAARSAFSRLRAPPTPAVTLAVRPWLGDRGPADEASRTRSWRELDRFFAEHAESVPYFAPEAAEHLDVMTPLAPRARAPRLAAARDEEVATPLPRRAHAQGRGVHGRLRARGRCRASHRGHPRRRPRRAAPAFDRGHRSGLRRRRHAPAAPGLGPRGYGQCPHDRAADARRARRAPARAGVARGAARARARPGAVGDPRGAPAPARRGGARRPPAPRPRFVPPALEVGERRAARVARGPAQHPRQPRPARFAAEPGRRARHRPQPARPALRADRARQRAPRLQPRDASADGPGLRGKAPRTRSCRRPSGSRRDGRRRRPDPATRARRAPVQAVRRARVRPLRRLQHLRPERRRDLGRRLRDPGPAESDSSGASARTRRTSTASPGACAAR